MIDFDENYTYSIKSVAIEKNSTVKLTTRFRKGNYIIEVFCFPDENVKKMYEKYISKMLPPSEFN